MFSLLERIKFRIVFWEHYRNEWPCLFIGMVIGGSAVLAGFILGNWILGKML